jgi:hypothetical protein
VPELHSFTVSAVTANDLDDINMIEKIDKTIVLNKFNISYSPC